MKSDFYVLNRNADSISNLKQKVDLIYIDPPFGLNKNFSMVEDTGEVKEFSDKWNSYDDFLNWYANTIDACFNALKKDGWLYCHNNHISNSLVLSKISILNSYYTNISWRRSLPHNNIKKGWGNIVDSILVFKKGNPYFKVIYGSLDKKYEENSFNLQDDKGRFSLAPITGEKSRVGHMFEFNGFSPKYGWRKKREDIEQMFNDNLIYFGKNKPYKKMYLSEVKGVPMQNFWDDIHSISRREGRIYPTQKPVKLLERIVKSSCPPDGIVFDPFCGSGTTLRAVLNVGENRKCITSDISEDAVNLVKSKTSLLDIDFDGKDIW